MALAMPRCAVPGCLRAWAGWCPRARASSSRAPASISPGETPAACRSRSRVSRSCGVRLGMFLAPGLRRCSRVAAARRAGMLSRYHRCQLRALSPPGSSSADRAGPDAKMILIAGPAPRSGPQFLQVVDPGALEPARKGTAERRALFAQCRDRLGRPGRRSGILLDQRGEPCGVLVSDIHRPGQAPLPDLRHGLTPAAETDRGSRWGAADSPANRAMTESGRKGQVAGCRRCPVAWPVRPVLSTGLTVFLSSRLLHNVKARAGKR